MTRMTERPPRDSRPRPSTWRERAFVVGAVAMVLPATSVLFVVGADGEIVGFVWMLAVAWTALASLAAALRCGILHGDWSAFRGGSDARHEYPPDTRAESFDWDTRTGAFAYMRTRDDRERLLDDDRFRSHDLGL